MGEKTLKNIYTRKTRKNSPFDWNKSGLEYGLRYKNNGEGEDLEN